MAKRSGEPDPIGVLKDLEDIKRLLMLALIRDGASQEHIAKALGASQPSISRMFPGGIAKIVKPKA